MDATAANTGAQASQAIQLLDWLAALNCGQLSSLEGDSATIQAKGILDVCERLLLINSELKQSQAETIERLLPHRLELAKQYQQRSYTTASERLAAQVVEVRRWARRIAEHLMGQISIDLKSHCEACTWNASLSQEIKQQLLDERSCCQAKPLTPLVKTNSEANPQDATTGGGARRRRRKASELTGAQESMAAAVREWHGYENESLSCKNCQSITQEELAKRSGFSKGKLTKQFFDAWFVKGGNAEYKRLCKRGDAKAIALAIARLSREGALKVVEYAGELLADAKAKRPGSDEHIEDLDSHL